MRTVIDAEYLPRAKGRFSQALRSDPFVFLAGQIASDFDTGLAPEVRLNPGFPYHGVPIKIETEFILARQDRIAEAAGTGLGRAAHVWSHLTDIREYGLYQAATRRFFDPGSGPAASVFGVEQLTAVRGRIEIDAILAAPGFDREVIRSNRLPQPPQGSGISQGVRVGSFIFVSSQAATDFKSSIAPDAQVPAGFGNVYSSVKRQTEYILNNISALLNEAGSSLQHVVKTQVFLPNLEDFAEFEEVWRAFFPKDPPARSVLPVKLPIPASRVEVNAIAIVPDGHLYKETVHTERAPTPIIHEPQGIKAGPFVFLSQVMATNYKNGLAPAAQVDPQFPFHDSEIKRQLNYLLENADVILQSASSSLKELARRQSYLSTFENNLPAARDVTLDAFFPDPSPSTTVSLGTGLLVPGCVWLLDAIGVAK